jgi:hypothetical protein
MNNHLQIVVYNPNYLIKTKKPIQIENQIENQKYKPDVKSMALAINALMIFANNDRFMQDVVDDLNEDNPCKCGNRKFVLNKKKTSFLRY